MVDLIRLSWFTIPVRTQFVLGYNASNPIECSNIAEANENREAFPNHKRWIVGDRILQLIFIEPSYFDGNSTTFLQELNSEGIMMRFCIDYV